MRPTPFALSIRTKLSAAIVIVAALVALSSIAIRHLHQELTREITSLTEELLPALTLIDRIHHSASTVDDDSWELWSQQVQDISDPTDIARDRRDLVAARDQLRESVAAFRRLHETKPAEHETIEQFDHLSTELLRMQEALLTSKEPANHDHAVQNKIRQDMDSVVDQITEAARTARLRYLRLLRENDEETHNILRRSIQDITWTVIIALVVGSGTVLVLANRMARSIFSIRDAALAIGKGHLETRLPPMGSDEIGELARTINTMGASLSETTVSKRFLDDVLASVPQGILVVDVMGTTMFFNEPARLVLGYPDREGMPVSVDSLDEPLRILVNEASSASSPRMHEQLALTTPSGEITPVEVGSALLRDVSGTRRGTVIVIHDIRSRLETEASLRRYREQLAHAEQLASLGAVSAQLAHKFNQPLTVLTLLLQQAIRAASDPQVMVSKMRECLDEVRLVSSTIKEVLRYTRPSTLEAPQEISVLPMVERVLEAFRTRAVEAGMQLSASGLSDLPPLWLPRSELEEILCTLVQNAIESAPLDRPSSLVLSGEVQEGDLVLCFTDSGVGISPEHLPKIFDLFFTTKPRNVGTGLGLSIVRQLVEARGGDMSVTSTLGVGTRFTLSLPTVDLDELPELELSHDENEERRVPSNESESGK